MKKADAVVDKMRSSNAFSIHLMIVCGVCVASFVVWAFVSVFISQWPWFIYVLCAGTLSIGFHFFVVNPEEPRVFDYHIMFFACTNVAIFFTWICLKSYGSTPWFLYVLFGLAVPLSFNAIFFYFDEKPRLFPPFHSPLFHFHYITVQCLKNCFIVMRH